MNGPDCDSWHLDGMWVKVGVIWVVDFEKEECNKINKFMFI